jgi:hypothetical protein
MVEPTTFPASRDALSPWNRKKSEMVDLVGIEATSF